MLTLVGVIARPRGMRESTIALLGATAVLVLGAVDITDAGRAVLTQWNVFLFFLGLMTIAAVAERSGLLEDLVVAAARAARGRADLLFLFVSGVALLVTITLTNDATVLLLTPLVVDMSRRLRVPVLPYAFACALLANTGSVALPIANPANVIVLRTLPLDASRFIALLLPSAAFASAATIAVLLLMYRGTLEVRIDIPIPTNRDAGAGAVAVGIGIIMCAYLAALQVGWPVGIVAVVGGAGLIVLQGTRGSLRIDELRRDIAWGIFPLLGGLVVVLRAAESAGLVETVSWLIASAAPNAFGVTSLAVVSAALANVMNNLPWALLVSAGAEHIGVVDPRVAGALLVGIDVGPNFTTLGSLATLLWLLLLRRRDVHVSALAYTRAAALPSLAALAAAIAPLLLYR